MDDLQVRWATPSDARGIAIVHVESWQAAYRGLIDDEVLDGLDVDQREAGWARWIAASLAGRPTDRGSATTHRLLVAESEVRVVGWASFGAGRDDATDQMGELAGLYVRPDFWAHGVGHALITSVDEELRAGGWRDAYLWVLSGNARAIRFYEQHGWHADGAEKVGAAGGAVGLRELRHVRHLG